MIHVVAWIKGPRPFIWDELVFLLGVVAFGIVILAVQLILHFKLGLHMINTMYHLVAVFWRVLIKV
jgi:hypothetical protein